MEVGGGWRTEEGAVSHTWYSEWHFGTRCCLCSVLIKHSLFTLSSLENIHPRLNLCVLPIKTEINSAFDFVVHCLFRHEYWHHRRLTQIIIKMTIIMVTSLETTEWRYLYIVKSTLIQNIRHYSSPWHSTSAGQPFESKCISLTTLLLIKLEHYQKTLLTVSVSPKEISVV